MHWFMLLFVLSTCLVTRIRVFDVVVVEVAEVAPTARAARPRRRDDDKRRGGEGHRFATTSSVLKASLFATVAEDKVP